MLLVSKLTGIQNQLGLTIQYFSNFFIKSLAADGNSFKTALAAFRNTFVTALAAFLEN